MSPASGILFLCVANALSREARLQRFRAASDAIRARIERFAAGEPVAATRASERA